MLQYAERTADRHLDGIYSDGGVTRDSKDAEKLCVLMKSDTFHRRVREFWRHLEDRDRNAYLERGIAGLSRKEHLSRFMEDDRHYAPGKTLNGFLEAVAGDMDLSRERSTMEYYRNGIPADDPNREEKLRLAARTYLYQPEGDVDPEALAEKLKGKK